MNKLAITIGFLVMVAAQWYVPGSMIWEQERTLTEGTPYKFKTRPVDPNDPFRGKYIVMRYEIDSYAFKDSIPEFSREEMYVYIKEGKDGFAEVAEVSATPLQTDWDYVKVSDAYIIGKEIHFDLPFDRFYMEESKAYPAEVAVRNALRQPDSLAPVCYGLVYIKGETAVLDNVFIGDINIKEFVENQDED